MIRAATLALVLAATLFAAGNFTIAQTTSTDPVVRIGSVKVTLPEPVLAGNVENVQAAIESTIGGLSYRQFSRDSVVAPVRIKLQYVKDDKGQRIGHLVHLAMIAHTDIDTLKSDATMRNLFAEPEADESSKLGDEELAQKGIESDDSSHYHRVQFELLERVQLDCVLRVTVEESSGKQRLNLVVDERFDNRWKSGETEGSYDGFQGWLHAARVSKGVVFIEARLAFSEPETWFRGSNFLRSKLPLALQEAAREFRRRLKEKK